MLLVPDPIDAHAARKRWIRGLAMAAVLAGVLAGGKLIGRALQPSHPMLSDRDLTSVSQPAAQPPVVSPAESRKDESTLATRETKQNRIQPQRAAAPVPTPTPARAKVAADTPAPPPDPEDSSAADSVAADSAALEEVAEDSAVNVAAAAGGAILPADAGGLTLAPGVYKTTSAQPSLGITGNLTLSGPSSGVWIFQIVSTVTTAASNSQVIMAGGATSHNVFWQVGSSATLNTNTTFAGTIMAQASISLSSGVTLNGRALARTGAVTLISDTVNVPSCP